MKDSTERYGTISRLLHWGMAILFAAQFVSAAAHFLLAREDALRKLLWSYHVELGITLFLLVILRGIWGLMHLAQRPKPQAGVIGWAALAGHISLYLLMIVVPASRVLAAMGSTRGLNYLGVTIVPPREVEIAWLKGLAEWHGEMGWILALLILGHIAMALIYHHLIRKDGTLRRMIG